MTEKGRITEVVRLFQIFLQKYLTVNLVYTLMYVYHIDKQEEIP